MRSAWFSALGRLILPAFVSLAAGCAADKDHVEKQLAKLKDEVQRMQSETDRMGERLDAMEARQATAPRASEERIASNTPAVVRPKLKVVHMEPGDENAADDVSEAAAQAPADDGPHVLIRGEGTSVETKTFSGSSPPPAAKSKSDGSKTHKTDAAPSK